MGLLELGADEQLRTYIPAKLVLGVQETAQSGLQASALGGYRGHAPVASGDTRLGVAHDNVMPSS
jgi:hypothetical protein